MTRIWRIESRYGADRALVDTITVVAPSAAAALRIGAPKLMVIKGAFVTSVVLIAEAGRD
jgi:hypothetical protein